MSSAAAISFSPSFFGTSQPGTVNGSVVDPIVPSRETRIGACGGDVIDLLRLGEEGVEALSGGGARGAGRILPDDVDLLAGVAGEALLGEVARRLRLRSGRVVVGVVLARQRGADADDHDRGGDPGQHHAAAAAVGEVGETG